MTFLCNFLLLWVYIMGNHDAGSSKGISEHGLGLPNIIFYYNIFGIWYTQILPCITYRKF